MRPSGRRILMNGISAPIRELSELPGPTTLGGHSRKVQAMNLERPLLDTELDRNWILAFCCQSCKTLLWFMSCQVQPLLTGAYAGCLCTL